MRTLKYYVEQQVIKSINDKSNIFKGIENYLKLEFDFNDDWKDCAKAIVFIANGKEIPKLLDKDNCCSVPKEACKGDYIWFYLVGKKKDYRIQTKKDHIELR